MLQRSVDEQDKNWNLTLTRCSANIIKTLRITPCYFCNLWHTNWYLPPITSCKTKSFFFIVFVLTMVLSGLFVLCSIISNQVRFFAHRYLKSDIQFPLFGSNRCAHCTLLIHTWHYNCQYSTCRVYVYSTLANYSIYIQLWTYDALHQ